MYRSIAIAVAMAAMLAAPATAGAMPTGTASAKSPATGTVYGGSTVQGNPVVVTLNGRHTAIQTIGIYVQSANYYIFSDTGHAVKTRPALPDVGANLITGASIARNGAFHATGKAVTYYGANIGDVTYTLKGKVKRRSMSGTMSAKLVLLDPMGEKITKVVKFPTLRWMAFSGPGRVYAGTSAHGDPVVVGLDQGHTTVSSMLIPWHADSDTTSWAISETFNNLSLTAGALSRTWSDPYVRGDGGKNTFDYTLNLKTSARTANGSLQVKVTETDAAGNVTASCDSGVVSFTTRSG